MKRIILIGVAICLLSLKIVEAKSDKVTNLIVMVGDGMGLAHLSYSDVVSDEPLFIERIETVGLVRTHSYSDLVTDSAASATAFACGVKTNNGVIGMDHELNIVESILERASKKGMATGVVATYAVTHATPAGYVAHNPSRGDGEGIAKDFVEGDIDLFIGGGRNHFEQRADGVDYSVALKEDGFNVVYTIEDVMEHKGGKLAALLADDGLATMLDGRGDMLPISTDVALSTLSDLGGKNGFFVMIEGSQIDGLAHKNSAEGVVAETIDFDKAVQKAFDFADQNEGTLVVVFADHETGGLTMPAVSSTEVEGRFSSGNHTGIMVPIYAYGRCAEAFGGIMDNTEIPKRMAQVMGIEW